MKRTEEGYAVIGGQYESHFYGKYKTLHQAKINATKNTEYWDNWGGWQTPKIYDTKDIEEIEAKGRITVREGEIISVPRPNAIPIAVYDRKRKEWINPKEGK